MRNHRHKKGSGFPKPFICPMCRLSAFVQVVTLRTKNGHGYHTITTATGIATREAHGTSFDVSVAIGCLDTNIPYLLVQKSPDKAGPTVREFLMVQRKPSSLIM